MEYPKFVGLIPVDKWGVVLDKLTDLVLTSKNDDKMPSRLANAILHDWQRDVLKSESGLTAMLEAALLLEPEKTLAVFSELQMENIGEQIKETLEL
jgi:hypothetical protein